MIALETIQLIPLRMIEGGTIRVTGSRVNLESIIWEYRQGSNAEQIHECFPSLKLADIHAIISYYLNHRDEVADYLEQQQIKAEEIRQRIESDPQHQARVAEMRERIRARQQAG